MKQNKTKQNGRKKEAAIGTAMPKSKENDANFYDFTKQTRLDGTKCKFRL